ncbi:AMIN-like domain-containing (lipo)protein [Ornithinimicrobium sp. Y1694]|uniref:AMIN-like domain-containing (lipo)protein n=1 Tax=Ornithinimicrobium sp. Y1694 TaxID=3418590 RepID=UPI003CEEB79D
MNERYDVSTLLEGAAGSGDRGAPAVDPDETWRAGRRRRIGKRVGAAALAVTVLGAAAGVAWQSGLLGGDGDAGAGEPAGQVSVPEGYTTFVFAAPDAPEMNPHTISSMPALDVPALRDTRWTMIEPLYRVATDSEGGDGEPGDLSAQAAIGVTDPITLHITEEAILGVQVGDCGAIPSAIDASLQEDGRFAAGDIANDSVQCATASQDDAVQYWIEALSHGGYVERLGGSWLLLSVQAPGPVGELVDGPAFRDPTQEWIDEPWPAAGGGLLAPTVRAGAHDGFDRVVLDLTGRHEEPWPGWRAAYTDAPTRDGSGLPIELAGDSTLEIRINGMDLPAPDDPTYDDGDLRISTPELDLVTEVVRTTPFEGQVDLVVGLSGEPRPYRVFLLTDPLRLVVDIEH